MPIKYPIEYTLSPTQVDPGMRWLQLTLENIGDEDLTSLDIRLNSLDTYCLDVQGSGLYLAALRPGEKVTRAFQVSASLTDRLYISLDGFSDSAEFHWESPGIRVRVGEAAAELVSLFAITEPYPPPGTRIRCEVTIQGVAENEGLTLEFWVRAPSDQFQFDTLELEAVPPGEQRTYSFDVTPEEEGSYRIYAYLYENGKRIGHETDYVYVVKP